MGFKQWINKVWSGGPREIQGGDPEANAILREELDTGAPEQAGGSPFGASGHTGLAESGESGIAGLEVTEAERDAIDATDPPSDA
jgi:hypothetical protein